MRTFLARDLEQDVLWDDAPWVAVMVDDEDYQRIIQYHWYLDKAGNVRTHTSNNLCSVYLSRFILNLDTIKPEAMQPGMLKVEVDHRDRDKLNNQKDNLRICNSIGNNRNKGLMENNSSGFKGVHFCKRERKYQARIMVEGYRKSLGYYYTPEEAARRYDAAALKYFGEFAVLNFPLKDNLQVATSA